MFDELLAWFDAYRFVLIPVLTLSYAILIVCYCLRRDEARQLRAARDQGGDKASRASQSMHFHARRPRARALRAQLHKVHKRTLQRFVFNKTTRFRLLVGVGRPLGTVPWDGALLLCQYFSNEARFPVTHWRQRSGNDEDDRALITTMASSTTTSNGRTVLELGAGTGMVGIMLARLGCRVCITDLKELLALMTANIELNSDSSNEQKQPSLLCTASALPWGTANPLSQFTMPGGGGGSTDSKEEAEAPPPDVIIGADVLYVERRLFEQLLSTLRACCGPSTVVYIAGARRHKHESAYLDELHAHFDIAVLKDEAAACSDAIEAQLNNPGKGYIYRLRRRKLQQLQHQRQQESKTEVSSSSIPSSSVQDDSKK
jgi:predicted nicotinamide N-methyase